MRWLVINVMAFVLLGSQATGAFARGGGGCVERGSMIQTPSGPVAIEDLRLGQPVCSFCDGHVATAKVLAVYAVEPDGYYELVAGGRVLRVTGEHPVATGPGVFRIASLLRRGDRVLVVDGEVVRLAALEAVRAVSTGRRAYNLLVSPGGTYLANGIVVHNKGCFLPETLIRRADGSEIAVAKVRVNDRVAAFTAAGELVAARVRKVVTHEVDQYLIVRTTSVLLHVTAEHPFYVGNGTFKTLESLKVGDRIFVFDGRELLAEPIESMETIRKRVTVYNLQTDAPHTYLANGVLVHNKGGGGGGGFRGGGFHGGSSHGSGSGSSDSPFAVIVFMGGVLVVLAIILRASRRRSDENLDFVYSRGQIAKKSGKTCKLLEFLSRQDPTVAPEALKRLAEATFVTLERCWSERSYEPMRPLLMPDLFREHTLELAGMTRQHEVNLIDDLKVDGIDLVNVRYTFKEEQREFTALITATARDYYVDDRTHKYLRGDRAAAQFQEFWTFQFHGKAWLLREIEQTRESDALKTDDFFEQFTDTGVDQIYGKEATKQGQAGPWLEKGVQTKETRIERLLNFLVETDSLWDRQTMLETTRRVFLEVMAARQSGNVSDIPNDELFPDVASNLKEAIARNRERDISIEFRNLCVRKVELILVRNFADNSRDEFVARVRAHAQRFMSRGGRCVQQDEDVIPFEQYVTMGRLENRWKLKEILSGQAGQTAMGQENLDEDSSSEQLQWYYQRKRTV